MKNSILNMIKEVLNQNIPMSSLISILPNDIFFKAFKLSYDKLCETLEKKRAELISGSNMVSSVNKAHVEITFLIELRNLLFLLEYVIEDFYEEGERNIVVSYNNKQRIINMYAAMAADNINAAVNYLPQGHVLRVAYSEQDEATAKAVKNYITIGINIFNNC